MPFGSNLDANLIKNNMVNENLDVGQKVKTGEENINTAELAQKALEAESDLAKLNAAEKQQTPTQLDSIRKSMPKTENNQEAELRKAHRVEFIQKALQMVIDNLQGKLDNRSLISFNWAVPKGELKGQIKDLRTFKGSRPAAVFWENFCANKGAASFVDEKIKEEIIQMVKNEFDSEDQKIFEGNENEQVKAQLKHRMTDVSAG